MWSNYRFYREISCDKNNDYLLLFREYQKTLDVKHRNQHNISYKCWNKMSLRLVWQISVWKVEGGTVADSFVGTTSLNVILADQMRNEQQVRQLITHYKLPSYEVFFLFSFTLNTFFAFRHTRIFFKSFQCFGLVFYLPYF